MTIETSIRLVRELPPQLQLTAATLIRHAVPKYFCTLSDEAADAIIASEFSIKGTELYKARAAVVSGEVVGVLCTYPMEELAERQYESFQNVMKTLNPVELARFVENLRKLRNGMPPIVGEGEYLAFICVVESLRGTELARLLLDEAAVAAGPRPLFLTVHLSNLRATSFYSKHRFTTVSRGSDFALLRRFVSTT